MKILTTIFFILIIFVSKGQNYQSINSKNINYFENNEGDYYLATRIDSFQLDSEDSVFYSFRTGRDISDTCALVLTPCWLGQKVIIKSDGTNLFFNSDGDTINIHTQAFLNDTFLVYTYPTGEHVKGWVSSIEEEIVLGVSDSVKSIHLFSNHEDFNLIDPILKIGKKNGFVTIYPFYSFPYAYLPLYNDNFMFHSLQLVGSEYPRVGITKNTRGEIHDHEVGDIIRYRYSKFYWSSFSTETRTADLKFIDKELLGDDTIIYTIEQWGSYQFYSDFENVFTIGTPGSTTKVVKNLNTINSPFLPEEFHMFDGGPAHEYLSYSHCGRLTETKNYIRGYTRGVDESDTTSDYFNNYSMGISILERSYYEGLGGNYFRTGSYYDGYGQDWTGHIWYYADNEGAVGRIIPLELMK
jgi:hypothetical protein